MLMVLCFGCKPKIPKEIIQPDQMQKILYDIHIADGYISSIQITDSARKVAAVYYRGIFNKFHTDSAHYNRSLTYYYSNPKELDIMYKNISRRVQMEKKRMEKADSLSKSKIKKPTPASVK